jgi:FkbM family methyltransferase
VPLGNDRIARRAASQARNNRRYVPSPQPRSQFVSAGRPLKGITHRRVALMRPSLTAVAEALSRSPFVVRQAVLARDACHVLIREHLADGIDPQNNGEAWLARVQAPRASTFIDVGANVGDWAALFLASMPAAGRGVLFDPSAEAAEHLRRRFSGHRGVEVVEMALSEAVGQASFFQEPHAGQLSSLVQGFSPRTTAERSVALTTLDVEAEKHGLTYVDFVKVDAEGYDLHVLRGASEMLSQRRIGLIQFEYHKPWAATMSTLGEAYTHLSKAGYRVFLLKKDGLFTLNYDLYKEYFGYSNFVGVAPDHLSPLEPYIKGEI